MGFGFLAIVISYLPTLYGAFSQRELNISLLDARAGSPPTAAELLRRHAHFANSDVLTQYLRDWEIWSAQLMESHLSYPVLCYFRSQHDNQSWLAAFTTVLDVSALIIAYGTGAAKWQAQLTFAISRHAVVDLAEVLRVRPHSSRQGPPSAGRRRASSEPAGGIRRVQSVHGFRRHKTQGIAEDVRALFERAVFAASHAASLLGRGRTFRGELETVGLGDNLFWPRRFGISRWRIRSFLKRARAFCGTGVSPVVLRPADVPPNRRRDAGATKCGGSGVELRVRRTSRHKLADRL